MDMVACLDLHDFSVVNNRMLWLLSLKSYFDNFKVSLFTVPFDEKQDWGPYTIRKDYLAEIKKNLDWIQLIPHGFKHNGTEVKNWTYIETMDKLKDIEAVFRIDDLPFEKGFCAPHWRWNEDVVRALNDSGWWGAVDRRQPKMVKTNKYYKYSHCLDEKWSDGDLKLHGHIYGTLNDLGKNFDKLLTLPKDTDWRFVTDFLEEL
jgi:predicted deacetylase